LAKELGVLGEVEGAVALTGLQSVEESPDSGGIGESRVGIGGGVVARHDPIDPNALDHGLDRGVGVRDQIGVREPAAGSQKADDLGENIPSIAGNGPLPGRSECRRMTAHHRLRRTGG